MAKFRAGKNSRAQVSSNDLTRNSYSVTYRGGDIDTTNFESEGYEEGIIGPIGADWNLDGHWNAGVNPFDDPPGLYPRNDGDEMYIWSNRTDDKYFNFPVFRCLSSTMRSTASGGVEISASGKNQGAFTIPSGSV